jgi:hypothetical protein
MTIENLSHTIYKETVEDLRAKIESKYESVSVFCEVHDIDKYNLYKIFSKNNKGEMSVGLFARIVTALGVSGLENVTSSNLSLKQYLEIDNNAIYKSILAIKFS